MSAPTNASFQDRPVPAWYDDAKLGIFIHWGLYSVPGWAPVVRDVRNNPDYFANNPYAEWYLNTLRVEGSPTQKHHAESWGKDFDYRSFAPLFNESARAWQPDDWAELFERSGAGYVVLTTKHHDGFLLWPSAHRCPAAPDYVAERDLVGELGDAVRGRGMRYGLYYSGGIDWLWHDLVIRNMGDLVRSLPPGPEYEAYATAHWDELIERYRPCSMWNDIAFPGSLEHIEALHARYYERVPDGVTNNRWRLTLTPQGLESLVPYDVTNPEYEHVPDIRPKKWESVRGIGNSFGYNRAEGPESYLSSRALLEQFVDIVSKNGNLLIDVGPTAAGEIPEPQRRPLLELGAWLEVHGEAIRATRPFTRAEASARDGTAVRFTRRGDVLYAILLGPTPGAELRIDDVPVPDAGRVSLLGHAGPLEARAEGGGLRLRLPGRLPHEGAVALRIPGGASGA